MKVTVDLQIAYNDGTFPEPKLFELWASAALASLGESCELTIRLVDEVESAELNANYRGKTGPTNVLSFPLASDFIETIEPRLIGDIIICAPVVEREAEQQGKLKESHWAHMVVHGCLHLLGYDHIEDSEANQMEALEAEILAQWQINNPYRVTGES